MTKSIQIAKPVTVAHILSAAKEKGYRTSSKSVFGPGDRSKIILKETTKEIRLEHVLVDQNGPIKISTHVVQKTRDVEIFLNKIKEILNETKMTFEVHLHMLKELSKRIPKMRILRYATRKFLIDSFSYRLTDTELQIKPRGSYSVITIQIKEIHDPEFSVEYLQNIIVELVKIQDMMDSMSETLEKEIVSIASRAAKVAGMEMLELDRGKLKLHIGSGFPVT